MFGTVVVWVFILAIATIVGMFAWKLGSAVLGQFQPDPQVTEPEKDGLTWEDFDPADLDTLTTEEAECLLRELSKRFPTPQEFQEADDEVLDPIFDDVTVTCAQ